MCKSLPALVAAVAVLGLIAASARPAVAQRADDHDAGMQILVSPSAAPSEPDMKTPPLDVAGCWSGETDDSVNGPGDGFIFFVQKGKKAVKGTNVGVTVGTGTISGPITGKVTSTSFFLKEKIKKCKISIVGQMPNEALVGSYSFQNCGPITIEGTFAYDFDPTDETCTP
jgi:hypothetical protein